jgi:hypothetical protein
MNTIYKSESTNDLFKSVMTLIEDSRLMKLNGMKKIAEQNQIVIDAIFDELESRNAN